MTEDLEPVPFDPDPNPDLGDGYDAYQQYLGMKLHFSVDYNWKKYGGKVTTTREAYEKRKDKLFFRIIQSRYSSAERNQIFLANFVYDKHLWIGEFLAEHCISLWHEWQGRLQRIEYQFKEDVNNSLDEIQRRKGMSRKEALKFLIRKPQDTHPLVLRFVWGGMFSIESYLLLSAILELRSAYQPFLVEDRLWADFEHKIEKYTHFLKPKLQIETNKQKLIELTKE